jgi:hypothetical protein
VTEGQAHSVRHESNKLHTLTDLGNRMEVQEANSLVTSSHPDSPKQDTKAGGGGGSTELGNQSSGPRTSRLLHIIRIRIPEPTATVPKICWKVRSLDAELLRQWSYGNTTAKAAVTVTKMFGHAYENIAQLQGKRVQNPCTHNKKWTLII